MKVQFILGSKSDEDFATEITKILDEFEIEYDIKVASAHKVPEKVFEIVQQNNQEYKELVYITIAGRSNGLSGVAAANSIHPVIACPPYVDKIDFMANINSTLIMPSDTPVLTVLDPLNCALSAIRILALNDDRLREKLKKRLKEVKSKF
ncbi:AIR carboxylase family protein [Patescibacteria group bacterium]